MYKIIINTSQDGTILIKNCSQYSILKSSIIELHRGENILEDLKYGFHLEYSVFYSNSIISIDFGEYDTSNIIDMNSMFMACDVHELDLSKFDTRNVTSMCGMFLLSSTLDELDLSSFDTSKVEYVQYMFGGCSSLVRLDLSNFDASSFQVYENMFIDCGKLNYIKCRKEFKEWCLSHQDEICLPRCLCEGGDGVWDIID